MNNLIALAYRMWTRRRNRHRLSVLTVALAVALAGTLAILTASMKSTLEAYIQTNFGRHHMIVEYRTHFDKHFGSDDVDLVRQIPGVADAAAGYIFGSPPGYPLYMGIRRSDPISAASVRVVEGTLPGPGEVVLPKGFAQRMNVTIGDEISLPFPPDANQTLVVTGFTQGISTSASGGTALFDMDWLQQTTGQVGQYQAILIALTRPEDVGQARTVEARLEQLFPEADVNPLDELRTLRRNMGGMGALATALAAFAFLATVFLVSGNFVISLRDRTRELATLRALGSSRKTILRVVLLEAVLMGISGSLAGIVISLACALGLIFGAGRLMGIEPEVAVIPWPLLIGTGMAGVVITLLASLLPAIRATRTSVVSALGAPTGWTSLRKSRGQVIGAVLAVAGLCAVLAAGMMATPASSGEAWALVAIAGGIALLVGSTAGLPLFLPWILQVVGRLGKRFRTVEARLAVRNAARYVRQARFMFASLSVGIALCLIVVSVLGAVRQSSDRMMKQQFPAPFVLRAAGDSVIAPEVAERLRSHPGIDRVTTIREVVDARVVDYNFSRADPDWVRQRTEQIELATQYGVADPGELGDTYLAPVDLAALMQSYPFEVVAGQLDVKQFQNSGAVVLADWANNLGLKPGDTIQVEVGKGEQARRAPLRVVALVKSVPLTTRAVLIDHAVGESFFSIDQDQIILVHPLPGAEKSVRESLKALQDEFSQITVHDLEQARQDFRKEHGQRLAVVVAAVAAILTASAGSLVTTVVTIIAERKREFGLLRAAGASARQVTRLVTLEILLVGGSSVIIALANSMVLTWALLRTLAADSPIPSVPAVVGCLVASLLMLWSVVRVGMNNLDQQSIVNSLSLE